MIDDSLVERYVRGIGASSAPFLDALWVPRENQDATVAAMLGLTVPRLADLRAGLEDRVHASAAALLAEPDFAADVERLPFEAGDRVLVVGDSISADALGWAELLAAVLDRARPGVVLENRAVAGKTTAETLYTLPLAAPFEPTHALVMLGTNDTRRLGSRVGARMAEVEQTVRNLRLVRRMLVEQLGARTVVLLTPPPVDPAPLAERRASGEWNDPEDVAEVAAAVRGLDESSVDVHDGVRPDTAFFDVDGLHPSPEGQVEIVRTVVRLLADRRPDQG